jgi:hypothetical protein
MWVDQRQAPPRDFVIYRWKKTMLEKTFKSNFITIHRVSGEVN